MPGTSRSVTRFVLGLLFIGSSAWSQPVEAAGDAPAVVRAPEPVTLVPSAPATPCGAPTILPQGSADCPESGVRAVVLRGGRLAAEAVLGAGLGALLGIIGAYAGLNIDLGNGREAGTGFGIGTAIGVTLGVAPGVWAAGTAMGGDGSFGWTLLASAAGTGISAGLLKLDSRPGMIAVASAIPVLSAIIAYELSSHVRRPKPPTEKPPAVTWTPTVGLGHLGVVGTF